jgi:signal transduction histidine kinase
MGSASITQQVSLEDLYAISQVITQAQEWKPALDKIVRLVRPYLIFDNLVTYRFDPETKSIDVIYARAVGRGKTAEADVAWGETLAAQVISTEKTVYVEQTQEQNQDRLRRPYLLGLPLLSSKQPMGALILIRFGGPHFTEEETALAEFLAQQMAFLVERMRWQRINDMVDAQSKAMKLQDDFIHNITHELRSPLGFIKGYTTTLLRSDAKWNKSAQQEFLRIIDQETDNLQELIENLLDSARLQSGQMKMDFQLVRPDTLIKDVSQRMQAYHKDLVVKLTVEPHLPPIVGDPRRLAQVFENLFSNAIKYAPGSEVYIDVKKDVDYATLTVKDHGPGIPEQYLNRVFERFFRNPDNAMEVHGSGLGLFICKQIIEFHNGRISVESEVGKGTTFIITLPLAQLVTPKSEEQS